ncbi:MAG: hypothetical protein WB763_06375 [Terriglobia bacterium]
MKAVDVHAAAEPDRTERNRRAVFLNIVARSICLNEPILQQLQRG